MIGRVSQLGVGEPAEALDEALHLSLGERCAPDEDGRQRQVAAARGCHQNAPGRVVDTELCECMARRSDITHGSVGLVLVVELAELGGEDPVNFEVLERLDDGVAGVEVALREHERARVRRVRRRVAVGRWVPHEVVVVVAS